MSDNQPVLCFKRPIAGEPLLEIETVDDVLVVRTCTGNQVTIHLHPNGEREYHSDGLRYEGTFGGFTTTGGIPAIAFLTSPNSQITIRVDKFLFEFLDAVLASQRAQEVVREPHPS